MAVLIAAYLGTTITDLGEETEMAACFRLRSDGPFRLMLPEVIGLGVFQTSVYLLYVGPGKIIGGTARVYNSRAQAFNILERDKHATPVLDILTYYVETACRYQVAMQSCQVPFTSASPEIAASTVEAFEGTPWEKRRDWPALLRQLDREDPSYAT